MLLTVAWSGLGGDFSLEVPGATDPIGAGGTSKAPEMLEPTPREDALPGPSAPPILDEEPLAASKAAEMVVDDAGCARTPLTPGAMAEALRDGHILHFGVPPHADRWACAWAHCAFEQARGGAIYGNNLGHITARENVGPICRRRVRERVAKSPDRWEEMDVLFRVFNTPAEGAAAYWRLLAGRYYSVLARCDEADARGAAKRLAEIGYFTGPKDPYVDGMGGLFVYARGVLIPRLVLREGEGLPAKPR